MRRSRLSPAVRCRHGDAYDLPPGACVADDSAYLDAVALVRGDAAEECLAAWETVLGCIGRFPRDETVERLEQDENGNDLIDRAMRPRLAGATMLAATEESRGFIQTSRRSWQRSAGEPSRRFSEAAWVPGTSETCWTFRSSG